MTHKPERYAIEVGRCPRCNHVHLIIRKPGEPVISIPLSRLEWARLIGAYGEILDGNNHFNNERII